MIYYYSISAILSICWMIMFLAHFEGKKINYYFTIFSLLTSIASLGYICLVTSSSVSEGILANKIIYLGGCFAPLVLFFAICSICNLKINKWLKILCFGYSFFVYALVCTIGYSEIYYKDVSLVDMGETFDALTVVLDEALSAVLELSGERVTEAVVDEVFSHFCVGK